MSQSMSPTPSPGAPPTAFATRRQCQGDAELCVCARVWDMTRRWGWARIGKLRLPPSPPKTQAVGAPSTRQLPEDASKPAWLPPASGHADASAGAHPQALHPSTARHASSQGAPLPKFTQASPSLCSAVERETLPAPGQDRSRPAQGYTHTHAVSWAQLCGCPHF